jgi:hypothetical protein
MTAHRARTHARHYRATTTAARAVPAHLAHLHPDWLPPGGYDAHGDYLDPADDLDAPGLPGDGAATDAPPLPIPFPITPTTPPANTRLPAGLQPAAGPPPRSPSRQTHPPSPPPPPHAGEGAGGRGPAV